GVAIMTINASTGSASYYVWYVPSIRGRIYQQCTWFVARTRLSMGLQPSPTAYDNYNTITPQWIPRNGDQLAWLRRHQGIITGVFGYSQPGGYTTWTLTVEEYNSKCQNNYNRYTATFQTQTINGQTRITQY